MLKFFSISSQKPSFSITCAVHKLQKIVAILAAVNFEVIMTVILPTFLDLCWLVAKVKVTWDSNEPHQYRILFY